MSQFVIKFITKNPSQRINWEEFFNHQWFENDALLNDANNLLEISFSNNLPNINKYNVDEKQFCSFIHKSIQDIKGKSITDSQNEDLEMNFLESFEDYVSANETDDDNDNDNEISSYDIDKSDISNHIPSQAIPINKPKTNIDNDFILINSREVYRNSEP